MSQYFWPPPAGGGSSSNASVGQNGVTAPTSSTEIAGVNPSGNLTPVSVDSSGNQNVNVVSSALPTGSATAANQVTGNTSLADIDTHTVSIDSKTPALGQAVAASSVPVVLPATQITALTPPTTVTVIQPTGTNLHTVVDSSALPTGASTAALQTTGNASLATLVANSPALGQNVMANSQPVAIASDQSAIPTLDKTLDTYVVGAGPATAVINTNLLLPTTGTTSTDLQGTRSISFQVVTGAATTAVAVNFEASNDNVNFVSVGMYDKTSPANAPVLTFTTAASTSRYFEGPTEFRYFRVRLVAAITAGTIQAFSTMRATTYVATNISLGAGSSILGTVTLNTGANVIGYTKAGGKTQSFVPVTNSYATTPVTTSTYLQLVASTTTAVSYLDIFDNSGQAMILATGTAGSEVIQCYIPPGGDQIPLTIPISTRIAIKALSANATTGYILLNGLN